MRFDDLFADLGDAFVAERSRQLWDEAAELARGEASLLGRERRLDTVGALRVQLTGGGRLEGEVVGGGEDWFALRAGQ